MAWLPENLDLIAATTGAIKRKRRIRTGEQLLRLPLAYSVLDLSLRGVSAWAARSGVAELSDVTVLRRLQASEPFMMELLEWMLQVVYLYSPRGRTPVRVRLVDATTLSAPGSKGTDWRIHVGYDVSSGQADSIEITDGRGAEHLGRVQARAGELLVADRGYARTRQLIDAVDAGVDVLVRISPFTLRLFDDDGERFDALDYATRKRSGPGRPPRVEEVGVCLTGDPDQRYPARLIVVRKSREAAEAERRRIRREGKRKGKTPTERSLAAAAFTFLLCTDRQNDLDARTAAELYRVRWQVELYFECLKSIFDLGNLRAFDEELSRTYILGKLLAASLADRLAAASRAYSPWVVPVGAALHEPVEAGPSGP